MRFDVNTQGSRTLGNATKTWHPAVAQTRHVATFTKRPCCWHCRHTNPPTHPPTHLQEHHALVHVDGVGGGAGGGQRHSLDGARVGVGDRDGTAGGVAKEGGWHLAGITKNGLANVARLRTGKPGRVRQGRPG